MKAQMISKATTINRSNRLVLLLVVTGLLFLSFLGYMIVKKGVLKRCIQKYELQKVYKKLLKKYEEMKISITGKSQKDVQGTKGNDETNQKLKNQRDIIKSKRGSKVQKIMKGDPAIIRGEDVTKCLRNCNKTEASLNNDYKKVRQAYLNIPIPGES